MIIIVALVKYDFIVFFFGCILLVSSILCACFGWHWSEREDMIEYIAEYNIISLDYNNDYQLKLDGNTAFSIGYISGTANKQAEYVVFENHDDKYIRKSYKADETFIKFSNDDIPHVTTVHKRHITKASSPLFVDIIGTNSWDEVTIVVPENTHQSKFNVE